MLWPHSFHYSQESLTELTEQGRGPPSFVAAAPLGDHTVLALEAAGQRAQVSILPLPLIRCVTVGELLKLSEPWFPFGHYFYSSYSPQE